MDGSRERPRYRGDFREDAVAVRDFGSRNGMLCAIRAGSGVEELRERAERHEMGCSALVPAYTEYDRALFIDMLNDWGWTGEGEARSWYTGEPRTE